MGLTCVGALAAYYWPDRPDPPEADRKEQKNDGQGPVRNKPPPKGQEKSAKRPRYGLALSMLLKLIFLGKNLNRPRYDCALSNVLL